MELAIMQPYFFPYIGYFQLINSVDEIVLYDNIEFTKKGWINRNRILVNGTEAYITLPLRKDSDFLNIADRFLADTWGAERGKLLNRIVGSYRRSPEFDATYSVIEECIMFEDRNLFSFVLNSIKKICAYLEISTTLTVSSSVSIDHKLRNQEKVLSICTQKGATTYINPIGGLALYASDVFKEQGINLKFLKSNSIEYIQFNNEFVPWLSIVDIMMFNSKEKTKLFLENYKLI